MFSILVSSKQRDAAAARNRYLPHDIPAHTGNISQRVCGDGVKQL
jgi:hypothetical protein